MTLIDLLDAHQLWLADPTTGKRLDLRGNKILLIGMDFRKWSLQKATLAWNDLSNCKMPADCSNANMVGNNGINVDFSISDCRRTSFEKSATQYFNFVGGIWGDQTIKVNPIVVHDPLYWYMMTDTWIQCGCTQNSLDYCRSLTDDQRKTIDLKDPEKAVQWWHNNQAIIEHYAAEYAAMKATV